jgi:hypothetical protein
VFDCLLECYETKMNSSEFLEYLQQKQSTN